MVCKGRGKDAQIRPQNNTYGGLAQLGERLHGMQEVSGSIPLSSTLQPLVNQGVVLFLSNGPILGSDS